MDLPAVNQAPIDVILFDLGNVILPFNHHQIGEKLSRFSQGDRPQDPTKIFAYLFDRQNGAVNLYESGKLSSFEFFDSLKKHFYLSLSFEEFIPIWNEIFTENQEVSEIIRSLKGKKRLGLVSNTNPLHFDYALSRFPILRAFDKWILSHEVGFKKPALRDLSESDRVGFGRMPEKILFIDDIERHVEAAISLGIRGIHFVSAPQLRKELSERNALTF